MKKVPVTAQLRAPVAIKRARQSERSESIDFVGGTMVRGALASLYLQHFGETDDLFDRLFLDENSCRYGPLDPGPHHFPLTSAVCKRGGITHALVDQLWLRVAQHASSGFGLGQAEDKWHSCLMCGAELKEHSGFWGPGHSLQCEAGDVQRNVMAHVGIDRNTATAADSIFYTLEAMVPSGREVDLYGWIEADDARLTDLETLLQKEDYCISVGHHRTRGYGDIHLQLGDAAESEDGTQPMEEWEQWSRNLISFLDALPVSNIGFDPEAFYFSLSFPTGAILMDQFLRYCLDPADMIPWLSPMPAVESAFPQQNRPTRELESGGTTRWLTAKTRHARLRGWNAAHGLPRQDEWLVERGAVYVYCFEGDVEQRRALGAQLGTLARDGVGLRRNEGFGTVIVSDVFHQRFHQQEVLP